VYRGPPEVYRGPCMKITCSNQGIISTSYPPLCTINKLQSTAWLKTEICSFFPGYSRQWTRLCWYGNGCNYQQYNQCRLLYNFSEREHTFTFAICCRPVS